MLAPHEGNTNEDASPTRIVNRVVTGKESGKGMKVAVIGTFYRESFARYIADALRGLGHTAQHVEVGVSIPPALGNFGSVLRHLRGAARRASAHNAHLARWQDARMLAAVRGCDLVLASHDFLSPATVRRIQQSTGAPVALWCPDHVAAFGRGMFLNATYDAVFLKDPAVVATIRRESGQPTYYLPECFSPDRHHPVSLTDADVVKYACDITTAGNMYPSRAAFFAQLTDYDVKIWGNRAPGWMDVGAIRHMLHSEYVEGPAKAKAFLTAKVVVNNLHHAEIAGINARAFEICGIGAFQMISWRPGLEQLFAAGTEIIAYRDISDLKAKLRRFLPDPDARAAIAAAGRARALREHTYHHRLALLLSTLEGKERGFPLPATLCR